MDDRTWTEPGTTGAMRDSARSQGHPAERTIPRQRDRHRGGVVVVVVASDHPVNTVLAGAKLASDREQPLDLVMFSDPDRSLSRSFAAVDNALTVARTAFPRLEVMVHLGLADAPGWEQALGGSPSEVVTDATVAARWAGRHDDFPVLVIEEPR
jgi:hypothetical protein